LHIDNILHKYCIFSKHFFGFYEIFIKLIFKVLEGGTPGIPGCFS